MATTEQMDAVMDAYRHLDFSKWPVKGRECVICLSRDLYLVYSEPRGRFFLAFRSMTDWSEARALVIGIRRLANRLVIECQSFSVDVWRRED